MASIRTVVVATDFSRTSTAAIERGAHLAVQHGASLWLLHALDGARAPEPGDGRGGSRQPATAALPEAQARQALSGTAAALGQRLSADVRTHCGAGSAVMVIKAFAEAHAGSLVVVGSRGDLDLHGLGTTASAVVRMPAAPTLVVRALACRPYGTVLSAVDLRAGSVRAASLAVELFPEAHHHLLHALDAVMLVDAPRPDDAEQPPPLDHDTTKSKAVLDCRRLALRLSASTAHPVSTIVAEDAPERAILVAAAELSADCVVVGHHGDGLATNSALGSMAEHVVHSAISDVLVVA